MQRRALLKGMAVSLAVAAIPKYNIASTPMKAGVNDDNYVVLNAGVSGNNTVDLMARLDKDCLLHQPKLTVLMVGTNDVNSQKYVPLNQFKTNLAQIITKLKAAGSQVLVMTILPWYEPYLLTRHPASFYQPEGVAGRRKQLNIAITDIANQHKAHLLDMAQCFEAIGNISLDKDSLIQNEANTGKTDGVHPTINGYRFIALAVYDHICYHELPTSGIVCLGDSITKGQGVPNDESYPANLLKLLNHKG